LAKITVRTYKLGEGMPTTPYAHVCNQVDIAPNNAVKIVNTMKGISLALSGCATQMAMIHPQGRVLQYNQRIEVHSKNYHMEKNAKVWPKGISFTSNTCALVYLVDQAGARSTSDFFHDLYADDIAESEKIILFLNFGLL
jgi:hypothetical protein